MVGLRTEQLGEAIYCKGGLDRNENDMHRRQFLSTTLVATAATTLRASTRKPTHIATNVYPWMTFYRRKQREWSADVDRGLSEVAGAGLDGFEPIGDSVLQIKQLGPLLAKHQLTMRSIYINSKLHDAAAAKQSIANAVAIAEAAKQLGASIIVVNPSPIRWGGDEDKSDPELREQARNLNTLGGQLRQRGLTLAYHNHDAELRQGGREFHHMLTATDQNNVKLCLDSHWIYRGCGDSEVAVFDAVQHYHPRIVELHLRQSKDGVWTEVFSMNGDIDYRRLFDRLGKWGLSPHLVLEQAVEDESPDTMTAKQAHGVSIKHVEAI